MREDEATAASTERGSRWRMIAWGTAAALILLPLLAMKITTEVNWDAADFGLAGALVLGVGLAYELAARVSANSTYRAAAGIALMAAFVLIWVNRAVGVIGSEDHPANRMYGGVIVVGIIGAIIARLRPPGWRALWSRRHSLRFWSP